MSAGLHDPVVFSCRGDHLAAFPYIVRDRLFDVNVLAGLARPDRYQRMPVIRRGGNNRVDILVLKQLSNVDVGIDLFVALLEFRDLAIDKIPIGIAKSHHPHAGNVSEPLDMIAALAAKTHHGHANIIIGTEHAGIRRERCCGTTYQGTLQKCAACKRLHNRSPYFCDF